VVAPGSFWRLGANFSVGAIKIFKNSPQVTLDLNFSRPTASEPIQEPTYNLKNDNYNASAVVG
jgi:hypothetical protein